MLVVYPGEYHDFVLPWHLKDRDERYAAWFAHDVKADGIPPGRSSKKKEDRGIDRPQ